MKYSKHILHIQNKYAFTQCWIEVISTVLLHFLPDVPQIKG